MKQHISLTVIALLFTLSAFGQTRVEVSAVKRLPVGNEAKTYYCLSVQVLKTDNTGTEALKASSFVYLKKDGSAAGAAFLKKLQATGRKKHCPPALYKGELFQAEINVPDCMVPLLRHEEDTYLQYQLERDKVLRQLRKHTGH